VHGILTAALQRARQNADVRGQFHNRNSGVLDHGAARTRFPLALEMNRGGNQKVVVIYAIASIAVASDINRSSGLLVGDQSGYNAFEMVFTGPTAEEPIGVLALPLAIDGQPHQLLGAWIAKRQ
jgi:hypothetical protein